MFSSTNAFQVTEVFKDAIKEELDLDTIEVVRSPICRPDSDCWDVKLTFFNPKKVFEQARKVYLFTVDVSDVVPVRIAGVELGARGVEVMVDLGVAHGARLAAVQHD